MQVKLKNTGTTIHTGKTEHMHRLNWTRVKLKMCKANIPNTDNLHEFEQIPADNL